MEQTLIELFAAWASRNPTSLALLLGSTATAVIGVLISAWRSGELSEPDLELEDDTKLIAKLLINKMLLVFVMLLEWSDLLKFRAFHQAGICLYIVVSIHPYILNLKLTKHVLLL